MDWIWVSQWSTVIILYLVGYIGSGEYLDEDSHCLAYAIVFTSLVVMISKFI
jgi:hypothetical protein